MTTPDSGSAPPNAVGALGQQVRNRFFQGKLLDDRHLDLEQQYANGKRWMLNRLLGGSGVVTGLQVAPTADGSALAIGPGVAVDAYGRELVVPATIVPVDPRQPTDEAGNPAGQRLDNADVTVLLAYRETAAEPVPVPLPGGDTAQEAGLICEQPVVVVTAGKPPAAAGGLGPAAAGDAGAAGGVPAGEALQQALSAAASAPPQAVSGNGAVVLATVSLPQAGGALTAAALDLSGRRRLVSTAVLADALVALAAAVPAPRGTLRYVSGDAQQAEPAGVLEAPIVVAAIGAAGVPLPDAEVVFTVRGGAGAVSADANTFDTTASARTGADGHASAFWRIGPQPGLGTVEATLAGAPGTVFVALGTPPAAPPGAG